MIKTASEIADRVLWKCAQEPMSESDPWAGQNAPDPMPQTKATRENYVNKALDRVSQRRREGWPAATALSRFEKENPPVQTSFGTMRYPRPSLVGGPHPLQRKHLKLLRNDTQERRNERHDQRVLDY